MLIKVSFPVFLPDAVICPQDVVKLLFGPRLQQQSELYRVLIDLLKKAEVSALFHLPIVGIEVALNLHLDVNVAGVPASVTGPRFSSTSSLTGIYLKEDWPV